MLGIPLVDVPSVSQLEVTTELLDRVSIDLLDKGGGQLGIVVHTGSLLLDYPNLQQKFQKHLHPVLTLSILLLIQTDPAVSIISSYKCVFDSFFIFAHTCVPYYTLVSSIVQI